MVFSGTNPASVPPLGAPEAEGPIEPAIGWDATHVARSQRAVARVSMPAPTQTVRAVDPTPTVTTSANRPAAALPTAQPSPTIELSSPKLAYEARPGCDPAYPDKRTCIPPGPPFNQGCKITDQRNFTVLPPDPQHLDADGDGIGCEPVKSK